MILFGEQSGTGHVLHLLIGPETELFLDVNGSHHLDVTSLLEALKSSKKVVLSINRCRSEADTDIQMEEFEIPHLCNFDKDGNFKDNKKSKKKEEDILAEGLFEDGDFDEEEDDEDDEEVVDVKKVAEKEPKKGYCDYCSKNTELLDIAGFKICKECVQIELGLKRQKLEKYMSVLGKEIIGGIPVGAKHE
jgi:hypothetical protein